MRKDYCELWWEENPAANSVITDIADRVIRGRNVILTHEKKIPWNDEFTYLT